MADKIPLAPACHKNKSVLSVTYIISELIRSHARKQAFREVNDFIDNCTEVEMRIVGHVKPVDDSVNAMKEIRRLFG